MLTDILEADESLFGETQVKCRQTLAKDFRSQGVLAYCVRQPNVRDLLRPQRYRDGV